MTALGGESGWLATKGLKAVPRRHGYGRYARLGRRHQMGLWLGINADLYEAHNSTPLWIEWKPKWKQDGGAGWEKLVEAALAAEMGPHFKKAGDQPWLAIVPKHGKRPDDYAAALERIANVLDTLADF